VTPETTATAKRIAVPSTQAWPIVSAVANEVSTTIEKIAAAIRILSMKSSRAASKRSQNLVLVGPSLWLLPKANFLPSIDKVLAPNSILVWSASLSPSEPLSSSLM
jgi:hypothetical protein